VAITVGSETRIEQVTTDEAFEALAPEWDELVGAMPRPSPFMLHGWLTEWWRHHGEGAQLSATVARQDGCLVAALPLVVRRRAGLRVASFMGEHAAVLPDLLLAEGADPSLGPQLAWLAPEHCDVVDFHGLPAGSRIADAFPTRLTLIERIEAPVLDLSAGWEEVYRAKTTSKKRNLHKRRRRQLGELGDLTATTARELHELEPALEEAFRLHAARWNGRPDGSCFATDSGRQFHRAVLRRLAALDVARITLLSLDGRAIAFHYWFALAGCMYVHRLAFDPAVGRFSPGLVNTLDAIQAAGDEGLTRVEFLGGDERYKVELADGFAPLYQAYGAPARIRGRAYAAAQLANIRLRLAAKRSPRLHRLYFEDLAPARRAIERMRGR
jgi:CelD/BcsL family acetyltransferase involved in cellulose biosynthesis